MTLPEDFVNELAKNKRAYAYCGSLSKANKYDICWRIQTAKRPETKAKRTQEILEMLGREEKSCPAGFVIPPQFAIRIFNPFYTEVLY